MYEYKSICGEPRKKCFTVQIHFGNICYGSGSNKSEGEKQQQKQLNKQMNVLNLCYCSDSSGIIL